MTEINIQNFNEKFQGIKNILEKSKFIAIDLEYSALNPLKNEFPSLFDNTTERYEKVRKSAGYIIPVQIGLTAFTCEPNTGNYNGTIYNFYLNPSNFGTIQKPFFFLPDTIGFLKHHGFDFNKFAYSGIPFFNRNGENSLRKTLKNGISEGYSSFRFELQDIYEEQVDRELKSWYGKAKEGDSKKLPNFDKKYLQNKEILYFVHKYIRREYRNVWTYVEDNELWIKKVALNEYEKLHKEFSLDENLILDLLGFTRIFRLLTTLKKPLIGHNLLHDIVLMYENFEEPLPKSYTKFKKNVNEMFPVIFDTKLIAYDVSKNLIPKGKKWREKGLESIFEYFKNGTGRHLALNSPAIEEADKNHNCYGKFHEAGWDSFCTGYIFIRMAYLYVYEKYPNSKIFTASELIGGIQHLKNHLNVIRGFNNIIKLDGKDPKSTRPSILVMECLKSKSIDIQQITSILSTCGFVEVKKLPYSHRRALIAVDNFGSLRRILKHFRNNKEFSVMPYSAIRHSPIVKTFLLSCFTIAGAIIAWMIKK